MNDVTQITPLEFTALLKVLTWILGVIGTFIVIGVLALFKMNTNISKLFTHYEVQKLKNETYDKSTTEIKERILILERKK